MNELEEYGADIRCLVYLGDAETWIEMNKENNSQAYKNLARKDLEKVKELIKQIPDDEPSKIVKKRAKEHFETLEAQLV